jgi:hypothetical protein
MRSDFTRRGGLSAVALAALAPAIARAAPADTHAVVEAEVLAFRKQLLEAAAAKDAERVRRCFAPDYTHAHGSGGVDDREARVAAYVSGKNTPLEALPTVEFGVRTYGRDTAIVAGKSPFNGVFGTGRFTRWMVVYVRQDGRWVTAASQATILTEKV